MTTVQKVVLNNIVANAGGTGHDWDNNKWLCSTFNNTYTFFITDPFTMLMLCLGYPTGTGATHDFSNDI